MGILSKLWQLTYKNLLRNKYAVKSLATTYFHVARVDEHGDIILVA